MTNLTQEQLLAVDKHGCNIIVSAGAGSGKTTVLKERVARILKNNVDIRNLIILTFTNNAAKEMKERIRKIIRENPSLHNNLKYLEEAYITTFDSYSQSIVRKYGYTINMNKDFTIIDPIVSKLVINNIIDDILEELYRNNNLNFIKLINTFYIKDDLSFRNNLKNLYQSYSSILNKDNFKDLINNSMFNNDFINDKFHIFEDYILSIRDDIVSLLDELNDETNDIDTINYNDNITNNFRYAYSYEELLDNINFSLKRKNNDNYSEKGLTIKDLISIQIKKLKELVKDSKKTLIDDYKDTYDFVNIIYNIIVKIDNRYREYKEYNSMYEFNDLALKAIEILENNGNIRNDIKYNTYEIMIDEYQDTNDIQEKFISLIANNNVYMVGDIKQSIYRFRNANPNIFKDKYVSYKDSKYGFKIDLNSNFRSRIECLEPINNIFSQLMTKDIGSIDYQKEHKMIFKNIEYNNYNKCDYKLKYLVYQNNNTNYIDDECEAFIIAKDILNKINNNYKVTDIENNKTIYRNIEYKDFCILIDKSKNFELFKKIFEYFNIPTSIEKDINILNDDETMILSNFIRLLVAINNKSFDNSFKHAYVSIARSYIFEISDKEIYSIIKNNSIGKTKIYQLFNNQIKYINTLPITEIIKNILNECNFYKKIIKVGNIEERISKVDKFLEKISNLNKIYTLDEIVNNLDEINNESLSIEIKTSKLDTNVVRIMTIHKSKGLEYPVVYLPNLYSNFLKQNKDEKIILDEKLGIISLTQDGNKSFLNYVYKNYEIEQNLYEKIRLFYVALTRAKENIIIIDKLKDDELVKRINKATSYHELLLSIHNTMLQYQEVININELDLTKEYNSIKTNNLLLNNQNKTIETKKIIIDTKEINKKHFSKESLSLLDEETYKLEELGTNIHYIFEITDFNNIDNIDDKYRIYIENFLKHEEMKDVKKATIYKELEIVYKDDEDDYHGFIDLLLEYNDHIDIIDYKLSNIDSSEYIDQLNGYKKYIQNKTNKEVRTYLYSILKDILRRIS